MQSPKTFTPQTTGDIPQYLQQVVRYSTFATSNAVPERCATFTPFWQIPPVLTHFTGRKSELGILEQTFSRQKRFVIQHTPQITGSGGIGKTQLAAEFVQAAIKAKQFDAIIWLNADPHLKHFHAEFATLAKALGIETKSLDLDTLVQRVYKQLHGYRKLLVVLDNAANLEDIQSVLPPEESTAHVLVTTRDNQVWGEQFTPVPLDVFSKEDAVAYIKKVLPSKLFNEEDAHKLAKLLGRFPLGLAQATGYISQCGISIQRYLVLYQKKSTTRQQLLDKKVVDADPHQETIWVTLNLCLEEISEPQAFDILPVAAFLAPESPIDIQLLQCWINNEETLNAVISQLRAMSLFVFSSQHNDCIRMHQLVQDVLKLVFKDENTQEKALRSLSNHIHDYFYQRIATEQLEARRQRLMPHLQTLIACLSQSFPNLERQHAQLYGALGACYLYLGQYKKAKAEVRHGLHFLEEEDDNEDRLAHRPRFLNLAALCEMHLGDARTAKRMLKEALDLQVNKFGANDFDRSHTLFNLAIICVELGETKYAIELLQEVFVLREGHFDPERSIDTDLISELASSYNDDGHYQQALKLQQRILIVKETQFGSENVNLIKTLSGLGSTHFNLGDYESAQRFYLRALEIVKSFYDTKHPVYGHALCYFGSTLCASGDYQRAEHILERACTILEEYYGKDHIKLSQVVTNLANNQNRLGKRQYALTLYERAYQLCAHFFSEDHPELAIALNNFAIGLIDCGQYQRAKAYLLQAIEIESAYFGKDHQRTLSRYTVLANCFCELGDFATAIEHLTNILPKQKRHYGREHPKIAAIYYYLAYAYHRTDRAKLAQKYYKKSLHIDEKNFGESNILVARVLNSLASSYIKEEDDSDALPLLERALKIQVARLGESHIETAYTKVSLAMQHYRNNNPELALQMLYQSAEVVKQQLGDSHPKLANIYNNLGIILHATDQNEAALRVLHQALAIDQEFYPEHNIYTAGAQCNLAMIYYEEGQPEVAEELQRKALESYSQILTHDSVRLGFTHYYLARSCYAQNKLEEAYRLIRIAFDTLAPQLGDDHIHLIEMQFLLANIVRDLGDVETAIPMYIAPLALSERMLNGTHLNRATIQENLAYAHILMDDYEAAIPLLESAYDTKSKQLGAHIEVANIATNLGDGYASFGESERALEYFMTAYTIEKAVLGDDNPERITACNNVATLYLEVDNAAKALPYLKEADALHQQFDCIDEEYAMTLNRLGTAYYQCGQFFQTTATLTLALELDDTFETFSEVERSDIHQIIGKCYQKCKSFENACEHFLAAQPLLEAVFGSEHFLSLGMRMRYAKAAFMADIDLRLPQLDGVDNERFQTAQMCYLLGKPKLALDQLAQCLDTTQALPLVQILQARCYLKLGDFVQCQTCFEHAEQWDDFAQGLVAYVRDKREKIEQNIHACSNQGELSVGDMIAQCHRYHNLYRVPQVQPLLDCLMTKKLDTSTRAKVLLIKASCHFQTDDLHEAKSACQKALDLDDTPQSAWLLKKIDWLQTQRGELTSERKL